GIIVCILHLGLKCFNGFKLFFADCLYCFSPQGSDIKSLAIKNSRLFESLLCSWFRIKPKIQSGYQKNSAQDVEGLFLIFHCPSSGLTPSLTSSTKILAGLNDGM